MTKVVEVVHYRTEKFTLTRAELVAALRGKYGSEQIFEEGHLSSVHSHGLFPGTSGYEDTEVEFTTKLN